MVHNEIVYLIIIISLSNKWLVSVGDEQLFFQLALPFFDFLFEQNCILSGCDVYSSFVIARVIVFGIGLWAQW